MLVQLKNLTKSFGSQTVLDKINLTVNEKDRLGIVGVNGAGKTTLFNCINRDIKMDTGSFYMEEDGVKRDIRAEDVGYVLSTPTVPGF